MTVGTDGRVLAGRYRVRRRLGRGGMATVFLAEDEHLGRKVAIKRLHSDSPDDTARRFAREARLGASLNHPNVVTVYDTAADDEGVLIAMEYVDGETLAEALGAGRMPPRRALGVIRDMGAALDHAHRSGVVHRDVKPANVLVPVGQGPAKLADLGIATAAENTRITRTGTVLGTPCYMAPEQLEGRPATPATDVYALAAVAFEALSGKKARPGRTAIEIAHKVIRDPPPDLRDAWSEAPPAAASALGRGMSREPGERQESAGELARELSEAFEERAETVRTVPVSTPAMAAATRKLDTSAPGREPRRGGVLALAAVLLVALAIVAVAALSGGSDSPEQSSAKRSATSSQGERSSKRTPSEAATQPSAGADPSALNSQGKSLMDQAEFAQAIPVLQKAVAACPDVSRTDPCAFAAFNLGSALRQAGRRDEAIQVLQRRLQNPDQHGAVLREIALAGGGGSGAAPQGQRDKHSGPGKGHDRKSRGFKKDD